MRIKAQAPTGKTFSLVILLVVGFSNDERIRNLFHPIQRRYKRYLSTPNDHQA